MSSGYQMKVHAAAGSAKIRVFSLILLEKTFFSVIFTEMIKFKFIIDE